MAKLTEPMIIARSKCSDLNAIKKLNCWGNDLADVSMVQRMTNVEVLVLSVNSITTLADFQHCSKLRELYLRKNKIGSLNEVCYLQYLPELKNLNLSDNPCAEQDAYRLSIVRALPRLEKLDEQEVSEEERRAAGRQGRELIHPEEDAEEGGGQSGWGSQSDNAYQYHEQHISNGLSAEGSPTEQCWDVDLEELESTPNQPDSTRNNFDTNNKVSPNQTPPEMQSPEPQRFYQEEYADRRNANYENANSSPPEQIGYSRTSAGSSCSYQPASHFQQQSYQQQQPYQQSVSPTYYAETPTSPDTHTVPMQRRPRGENISPGPCTPPSPNSPPQQSSSNGGSPCESDRGPRCRADGEARLCSDLPCAGHQADEDFCRAAPQHQPPPPQVRHRYTPPNQPPVQTSSNLLPRKSRTSNILSAVLCLLKELDYHSLEVVDTTVNARMNELMHEHDA